MRYCTEWPLGYEIFSILYRVVIVVLKSWPKNRLRTLFNTVQVHTVYLEWENVLVRHVVRVCWTLPYTVRAIRGSHDYDGYAIPAIEELRKAASAVTLRADPQYIAMVAAIWHTCTSCTAAFVPSTSTLQLSMDFSISQLNNYNHVGLAIVFHLRKCRDCPCLSVHLRCISIMATLLQGRTTG